LIEKMNMPASPSHALGLLDLFSSNVVVFVAAAEGGLE
jgi:hypothetical protein